MRKLRRVVETVFQRSSVGNARKECTHPEANSGCSEIKSTAKHRCKVIQSLKTLPPSTLLREPTLCEVLSSGATDYRPIRHVDTESRNDLELRDEKTWTSQRGVQSRIERATHSRQRLHKDLEEVDLVCVEGVALLANGVSCQKSGDTTDEGCSETEFTELGLKGVGSSLLAEENGTCKQSKFSDRAR